jgi:hypothetical protein
MVAEDGEEVREKSPLLATTFTVTAAEALFVGSCTLVTVTMCEPGKLGAT